MWALLMEMMQQVAALAVAGLVEGIGIPWPGIVIMATTGMSAGTDWQAVLLFTLVFCGAYTVGSLVQYGIGRMLGPMALAWLSPQQRAKLEGLVSRYGMGVVFWARPLAIGNYVSIPAGMLKMNPVRFALYTFVGAIPWAGGTILAGSMLGTQTQLAQELLDRWMLPGVGVLALLVVAMALVRLAARRRRPVPESA